MSPRFGSGGATGNTSSTGFLKARFRFGDPAGLDGRAGDPILKNPTRLTPGIDFARDIGGVGVLAAECERT